MIELIRSRCGWNNHKRWTYRALISIRRTINNCKLVASLLLRNKCCRTAAVLINCGNTSGIKHNLREFFCTAASREWLLTTVEHHQNNFSARSDTDTGTWMAIIIIIRRTAYDRFSVFNQINTAANSFPYLILINSIFACTADHGRTILHNGKEVWTASVILLAFHNQSTVRHAVRHIIEIRIDADHCIVMLNIVRSIRRIWMFFLSRCHLVGNTGHRPALRRVICVIISINVNIISWKICCGNIVNYLFIVPCKRVINGLWNAGSNRRCIRWKHRIISLISGLGIRIIRIHFRQLILTVFIAPICKNVAASFSQQFNIF